MVVGQSETADVHRLGIPVVHDPTQAQVASEAPQGAQPRGQPVHLLVALEGGRPMTARRATGLVETGGQVSHGVLDGGGDRCEVGLVGADEGRVGLGGERGG